MKKLIAIAVIAAHPCFAGHAVLFGTATSLTGKLLIVTLINYETRIDTDNANMIVAPDGSFMTNISLTEPGVYSLRVGSNVLLHLLIKPDDIITLRITKDKIVCTGSLETQYLVDYESNRRKVFEKLLQPVYDSLQRAVKSQNGEKLDHWNEQHKRATENYKAELTTWVKQPFFVNSIVAIHHSLRWHPDYDTELMDKLVANFQRKYPGLKLTSQLTSIVNRTKNIAIGAKAPEFRIKSIDGHSVDLQSYRGQFILVDFWASWCGPCRQESANLVKLYNAYKEKGFTILSISIDSNRARWIAAVKKDGYIWQNVSDLAGYASPVAVLFNVTAIPYNFLLDKDGTIISKDLRGKDLEHKLSELLEEEN